MMRSFHGSGYSVIVLLAALLLLPVTGCGGQVQEGSGEPEGEIDLPPEEDEDFEAVFARLEQEAADEGFSEEQYEALLREHFSEAELKELAVKRGLIYRLEVNSAAVTVPEIVVTAGEMLSITVSEAMVMDSDEYNTLLPNKILQLAMLDDLADHIEVVESNVEFFDNTGAGTIVQAYGFFCENAGQGTVIKVRISETMRDRLGLNFREFTVRVE
ncbi:MAG: hypothetical protein AB1767_06190 [Bacillota bacterium]